jgi:hypothetical protein
VTREDPNTRDPLDQQRLPLQGKTRTAVVAIVIIVLLILAAFFVGLRFSKPGKGILIVPDAPAGQGLSLGPTIHSPSSHV